MAISSKAEIKLENFDDLWGLGDPMIVEKKLQELLPQAKALKDHSIYLQILSQIALAQAVQQKFDSAHKILNDAEALLTPDHALAKVRILLERGRVYQQAEKISEARTYFERSFDLSKERNFDYHTINAAHMIAIVEDKTADKIKWNQLALNLALKTSDQRASLWLGPLFNNLGRNYLEEKQFDKALSAFQKALEYREKEAYVPNILFAKWAVARALRSLDRLDDALDIQNVLAKELEALAKDRKVEAPAEMVALMHGFVYEELAEIYHAKAKKCASIAYEDLCNNPMFTKYEKQRLKRLKTLKN